MKDQIEKMAQEKLHTAQENANQVSWLMHWVMFYSFSTKNESLYAHLLTDNSAYGHHFMSLLHLPKFQHHIKYLVSALLLSPSSSAPRLQESVLNLVKQEKGNFEDAYTRFTVALYEDFEFDEALK